MNEYDLVTIEGEIFPNLPKGWIMIKLEQLFDISYGLSEKLDKTVPTSSNDIPVIRIPNITDNGTLDLSNLKYFTINRKEHPNLFLKKNDVLFNWRNAPKWIGRSATFNEEGDFVNASFLLKLRPYVNGYSEFISIYLNYLRKKGYFLTRVDNAVNQANFNATKLKFVPIILPPLEEQRRIISKIGEFFSRIEFILESLTLVRLQLIQYKQALLQTSFEINNSKKSLFTCADIGTGGTPSRKHPEYYGSDIPWVKTFEVTNSHITDTEEKITRLGLQTSNAKIYPKNSVVLAMYGEGKTRGRCAILDIPAATNQACAVIVCNTEKLYNKYCFYWLQSQYFKIRAKSSGGNQPNLNLGIVKKLEIPLPDLPEQHRIVQRIELGLSQLEFLESTINHTILFTNIIKNSVLKLAFEGKLVPQDPNDEPAEILLQRIKQEKEKLQENQKVIRAKAIKTGRVRIAK